MLTNDTIAAIAATGALSVVRASGPLAYTVACKMSHSQSLEPRFMHRVKLFDQHDHVFDDGMMVFFKNPQSFTGEDTVEYYLHGGKIVAQNCMQTLEAHGIRQALPGEFSFRACMHGKMDVFQAEAIADLIGTRSVEGARLALEKLSGSQQAHLHTLRSKLIELAAQAEVAIDFADQDVAELSLGTLQQHVRTILDCIHTLAQSFERGRRLQMGCRIALVGVPNAGKSSFFNALVGEKRAIVSDEPGTTRDSVSLEITLGSGTATVEDTAGLRTSSSNLENLGIERTHQVIKNADIIVLVIDGTEHIDSTIFDFPPSAIAAITKKDLQAHPDPSVLEFLQARHIPSAHVSAHTGEGIATFLSLLQEASHVSRGEGELLLTRPSHLNSAQAGKAHLERALGADTYDLFASDLRQAIASLAPLLGGVIPDTILEKIFSDFCIGK